MSNIQTSEDRKPDIITELDRAIELYNLPAVSAKQITLDMKDFYETAKQWEIKVKAIKVTSELQVREMNMAREARLALREIRVSAEKTKDKLKRESLDYGNAVQKVYNMIKGITEPLETYAELQEKFAENAEKKRKQELLDTRTKLLAPYREHAALEGIDLSTIGEELFFDILDKAVDAKQTHEVEVKRLEDEKAKKAEDERLEKERLKQMVTDLTQENQQKEKEITKMRTVSGYGGGGGYVRPAAPVVKGLSASQKELASLQYISNMLKQINPEGREIENIAKVMNTIIQLYRNIDKRVAELERTTI